MRVHIAVEDSLSEAVLRRLLDETRRGYEVVQSHPPAPRWQPKVTQEGYGYIKVTLRSWNEAAKTQPFIVLVDLDDRPCAAEVVHLWLEGDAQHPNLVFRVAVREVESWLVADRDNLADFLQVPVNVVPANPDTIVDPKAAIITAADQSPLDDVKDGIVPLPGSTVPQGRYYNQMMRAFVRDHWDIQLASASSPSLHRAYRALVSFVPQ